MTREEILDYLSSKGIDLEQGPDPNDFSLDGTIILCGIRAYLSVDMTRKYFRTDPSAVRSTGRQHTIQRAASPQDDRKL